MRVLAVALALLAWPAASLGDRAEDLGCDSLSPFGNSCQDCCAKFDEDARVGAGVLGFAGEIEIRLDTSDGGFTWTCWALGADLQGTVPQCTDPVQYGDPDEGEEARLLCWALPTAARTLPVALVGPAGPWGCFAEF